MAGESARAAARRAREKADRLRQVAYAYDRGAEGEAATSEALRGLPVGWMVLHDLCWPGRRFANIDHVVVGPGGVFVVDSKNWSGEISVDGRTLRQNGRSRERSVASCADAGLAVAELVPAYAAYVQPVLCFVRDENMTGWARHVATCSTVNLVEMLTSMPPVFGPSHVDHLSRALRTAMPAAAGPRTTRPGLAQPRAPVLKQRRPSPPRRKRQGKKAQSSLGSAIVGLILLAVAFVPPVREFVVGKVTELVVPETSESGCDLSQTARSGSAACPDAGDRSPRPPRQGTVAP